MGCAESLNEGINEVIATTYYNAAPMGIIRKDDTFHIAVFRTSHTSVNLEKYPWIIANITDDPVMYVRCAFSDPDKDEFIIEEIEGLQMHRLAGDYSYIAFKTEIVNKTEEKLLVKLIPIHEVLKPKVPVAFNRGFANIIEATVHGTRYLNGADELKPIILNNFEIIQKCGGKREKQALSLLRTFLNL